ncbi:DUF6801 domain-containing protein [Nocardioides antri]|uniref:DUF6801 domain-containing protein n=1 Tax=Nocardioides antri TaxID=2607659 RepID=A0A5B1M1N1_9ACTN|nr:DUF6801 domain-containing protein [Nocardioides antri]KAA1425650.1 hypothetical protein F0U47_17850 [Nocardioides antri]
MSRRRATGFAVLTVLLTLLGSLLVGTAPARAELRVLDTTYACDSSFGGGSSAVRVKVDVPDRVRAGRQVDARRITFRIVVPDELVQQMRDAGVEEVSARSDDAKYRVGTRRVPIRNLTVPPTAVPADGDMVIRGRGRAGAFTIDQAGRYAVKVPRSFTAVVQTGILPVSLSCTLADGAPARLSTLRVVR